MWALKNNMICHKRVINIITQYCGVCGYNISKVWRTCSATIKLYINDIPMIKHVNLLMETTLTRAQLNTVIFSKYKDGARGENNARNL